MVNDLTNHGPEEDPGDVSDNAAIAASDSSGSDSIGPTDIERDPFEEVASEFSDRYRNGEMPSIEEYVRRYPDLESEIRDLFPTIAAMEQLKERKAPSKPAVGSLELEQLGDFRILGEIGRGGMGVVYEAEQVSLGRHVAVKVLPKQALLDERHLRRFEREAQTAAKLHHTNIVPVFGVGQQDGYHYIVMQFIAGVGLDEILVALRSIVLEDDTMQYRMDSSSRASHASHNAQALLDGDFSRNIAMNLASSFTKETKRPGSSTNPFGGSAATLELPSRKSASLGTSLNTEMSLSESAARESTSQESETTQPTSLDSDNSRVLASLDSEYYQSVARIGQQVADALAYAHEQGTLHRDVKPGNLLLDGTGTVWVADFGLAKLAEQDAVSRTGDLVGTLSYMPPESFSSDTDARGDIYSLGLTLYEMLAMRPAYYGRDRGKLVKRITEGELPKLSKLNPAVPRDLETIVLKSIAHRPEDRYATARDMEEDLQSFLHDMPIKARRMSVAEQFTRWCRKNKLVASLSAAVLSLLIISSGTFGVLYRNADTAYREADTAYRKADAAQQLAEQKAEEANREKRKAEKATDVLKQTAKVAIDALLVQVDLIVPDRLPLTDDQSLADADSSADLSDAGSAEDSEEGATATVAVVQTTPEMAAKLELVLKSFEELAKNADNDEYLAPIFADLTIRTGKLYRLLGNHDEALNYFDDGIKAYREIVAQTPTVSTVIGLASSINEKGDLLTLTRQRREGSLQFEEAAQLFDEHRGLLAGTPRAIYEEARTNFLRSMDYGGPGFGGRAGGGSGSGRRGNRGGGRPRGPGSGEASRPGDAPESGPPPRSDGERPSERYKFGRDGRQRVARLQKAVDLLQPLVKTEKNPEYRYLLARCFTGIAINIRDPRENLEREKSIQQAITLLSDLVKEQPNVWDYKFEFAIAKFFSLEVQRPSSEDRLRVTQEIVEITEEISTRNPAISSYAFLHARALITRAMNVDLVATQSQHLSATDNLNLRREAKVAIDAAEVVIKDAKEKFPAATKDVSRFYSNYVLKWFKDRIDFRYRLAVTRQLEESGKSAEATEALKALRSELAQQVKKELGKKPQPEVRFGPGRSGSSPDHVTNLIVNLCRIEQQLRGTEAAVRLFDQIIAERDKVRNTKPSSNGDERNTVDAWNDEITRIRVLSALKQQAEAKSRLSRLVTDIKVEFKEAETGGRPVFDRSFMPVAMQIFGLIRELGDEKDADDFRAAMMRHRFSDRYHNAPERRGMTERPDGPERPEGAQRRTPRRN